MVSKMEDYRDYVFRRWCLWKKRRKHRVIHALTFEGPRSGTGGETRWPVNAGTDWEQVPGCELRVVVNMILKHIVILRDKFGVSVRILIQMIAVKSAFRQDPGGASRFAYDIVQFLFVDFRLRFRWRGSPGL